MRGQELVRIGVDGDRSNVRGAASAAKRLSRQVAIPTGRSLTRTDSLSGSEVAELSASAL
jgi:hypothetical protein